MEAMPCHITDLPEPKEMSEKSLLDQKMENDAEIEDIAHQLVCGNVFKSYGGKVTFADAVCNVSDNVDFINSMRSVTLGNVESMTDIHDVLKAECLSIAADIWDCKGGS